jgi:hypothetical protein
MLKILRKRLIYSVIYVVEIANNLTSLFNQLHIINNNNTLLILRLNHSI